VKYPLLGTWTDLAGFSSICFHSSKRLKNDFLVTSMNLVLDFVLFARSEMIIFCFRLRASIISFDVKHIRFSVVYCKYRITAIEY
jgi:hypothetical protein